MTSQKTIDKNPTPSIQEMTRKRSQDSLLNQVFVTQTKGFADISGKVGLWSTFAEQTGGVFTLKHTVSKDLNLLSLSIPTEYGLLEFTESDTHPFKSMISLVSDQQIEFNITHKDLFDRWIHFFGFRGVPIPHPEFQKKYIIRGEDKKTIQQILAGTQIMPLILKTNIFQISCRYHKRKSALQIRGTAGRSVNSIQDMTYICTLFTAIAAQINIKK